MIDSPGYWSTLAQRRISRRRALAGGTAVAAATIAAAAGCARSGGTPHHTAPSPPQGGTLRFGTALPVAYGLDPHVERGAGLAIFPKVYGYLHHVDAQQNDTTLLDHAGSVEQPDAMTLLFRLRSDVRFQDVAPADGRPVASSDVAASVLRYRDSPLAVNKIWHTTVLDRIETPDASTLRVITKRPYVYSLQWLGDISAGAILPREQVDSHADLRTAGSGSGPFAIDHIDTKSQLWRLKRNAGYYKKPAVYLDAMQWHVYPDDASKVAAFGRRDVDAIDARDKAEAQAAQAKDSSILVDAKPSLASLALGLRTDAPPLSDARVREAIDIALDRDALIRDIAPGGGAVTGPVNPHLAGGYWSLPETEVRAAFGGAEQDDGRIARAKALLAAAGGPDAQLALQTVDSPRMIDLATAIREQLLQIGIDLRIDELDPLTWFANFRTGRFQITLISHEPYESTDMPTRFFHSGGVDANGNMFALHDAGIDALVERSWGEDNRAGRRTTLLAAQRLMLGSRAMLQLFTNAGYNATWDSIQDRGESLIGSLAQYHVGQWIETPAARQKREATASG
jgi:peptide/nickel transport system substrate-binding protein